MATVWPSYEDKIKRAVVLLMKTITVANGFESEVPTENVVDEARNVTWMQNHAPSIQVLLGDESVVEENIGDVLKLLEVHVTALVKDKDNPLIAAEKIIADIKTAFYTPNKLTDPDVGGFLNTRTLGLEVERLIGDPSLGVAGAQITVGIHYPERVRL